MGYMAVPASSNTLCRFAAFLAQRLKFGSIKQYMNIIRLLHAEWGLPNPAHNNIPLDYTLKGIKRCHGDFITRKQPITLNLLRKILTKLDLTLSFDATVWAVSLCMFFGLLRKSNIIPDTFDPVKHLRRCDVQFFSWGVSLKLRWSKTNQFKDRSFDVPLVRKSGESLCPVQAVFNSFCSCPDAPSDGPAFVYLQDGKIFPMVGRRFLERIHSCLTQAGVDPSQISNHSWRRGGATFLYETGASSEAIKLAGDWRSNCYMRYIDNSFKCRKDIANSMMSAV